MLCLEADLMFPERAVKQLLREDPDPRLAVLISLNNDITEGQRKKSEGKKRRVVLKQLWKI